MVDRIDHIEQSKELMLSQFERSPDILALIASWLTPVQDSEDALLGFMEGNGISLAIGEMLDIIGSWMGVPRDARLDEEYRQAILAEAILEGSDGTTTKFQQAMEAITQSNTVRFYENYPATVYAHLGAGWNNATYESLKTAKMAGIGYVVLVDYEFNSFYMTDIIALDNAIIDHTDDEYVLNTDGVNETWISSSTDSVLTDNIGTPMNDTIDDEWIPMCDVVGRQYRLVEGFIVDEQGNQIVDNDGNPITYRNYEA